MLMKLTVVIVRILRYNLKFNSTRYYTDERPTIYQLSSGFVKSGVAVIRVSGESSLKVTSLMTISNKPFEPRRMYLKKIKDSVTREVLDSGFVVTFHKPNSFTGEDMVELHVHGGIAVVKAVLGSLSKIPSFQPAEPGEFTRRAFLNGKLDLTEIEGLSDLLQAETEAQRRQALKQMEGALGKLYSCWKEKLIRCLAQIEAYIDFGEEENIEEALQLVKNGLKDVQRDLYVHLNNASKGQRLRSGVQATIVGKPNVGKSSLLNAICGQDLSIISPIAGTTRDVVESALNVGGYPLLISDTAGIRHDTHDPVEEEGVKRALKRAKESDLIIAVYDASLSYRADVRNMFLLELNDEPRPEVEIIFVLNKSDQLTEASRKEVSKLISSNPEVCLTSCETGEGLNELSNVILGKLKTLCGNPLEENASITQERHRFHVQACYERINRCVNYLKAEDVVFASEELRQAVRSLGKITGKVTTEEVLDVIFKDFCIGK